MRDSSLIPMTGNILLGCPKGDLDGIEIGRVNIDVRSPDMVPGGDAAYAVDLIDFSEFGNHYPSCESGSGNYNSVVILTPTAAWTQSTSLSSVITTPIDWNG